MGSNHPDRTVQWSRQALQVDNLLQQLTQDKPKWAKAVKYHYTEPGDVRLQAQKLNLAKSTYHDRIQKGREWLGQKLYQLNWYYLPICIDLWNADFSTDESLDDLFLKQRYKRGN